MSEWKECKLGDLTELITKGTTPSSLGGRFVDKGINYIKSEAVGHDGRIDKSTFVCIDAEMHQKLKRSQLAKDDILFSMAGIYLGKSALVPEEVLPANTNQALAIIRLNKGKANPKFIHYYLRQRSVIDFVNNMSGQSAQPNINFEEIKSIDILLPELNEQLQIADILSSLDDKIDLLHRQNKTLEQLAETLFRQWFVEEAEEQSDKQLLLGDLIDSVSITHKFPSDKIVFLNTSDIYLGNVLVHEFSDVKTLPGQAKKSIQKDDILFSEIRPANGRWSYINFNAENYVVSTKLMVLRSKNALSQAFIYFYLTNSQTVSWLQVLAESRSGTFPQITFDQLKDLKINIPDDSILKDAIKWCETAIEKIKSNTTQIRTLTQLRDTLLPKLMSGEVRVKN